MPYNTPSSTDPFSLRCKNMSFETIYQIYRITQPHFMQFLIGIRIITFLGWSFKCRVFVKKK